MQRTQHPDLIHRFTARAPFWLGAALTLATGLTHLAEVPEGFDDAAYEGVLFLAAFVGAVIVAAALLRGRRSGWLFGALLSGAAAAAYLTSRTLGLPALSQEPFCALGAVSLAVEGLFVALAIGVLRSSLARRTTEQPAAV